ncbi:MAG TPA: TonB-dependent receptor [Woeseiaceae bacterium]|nr:TonB-dependent receptor [Woeseiaceae bacterium]
MVKKNRALGIHPLKGRDVGVLVLCAGSVIPMATLAQELPAGSTPTIEEVVVTGSRIKRDGFDAPTPVTVIGEETIEAAAPQNLADFVNDLPSVVGSQTPQNSNLSFSNGQAGINALNLRGLGTVRTLVLLDGRRSVPSSITGIVDINSVPQALVERVEIVTGGASAAYGSDAMSGVVNFILDKDFTGVEGELSGGQTGYGDDESWKASLTGGFGFADGRGHVLLNGEYANRAGIYGVPRDWNNEGWYIMNNPAYTPDGGLPQRLVVNNASFTAATLGGIILDTSLRGTTFGQDGVPRQFEYGSVVSPPWMQGGEWANNQFNNYNTLDQEVERTGLFGRVSYDVTDTLQVFGEFARNDAQTLSWQLQQFNVGNIAVRAGNPFIPSDIAAQMAAEGITQFTLGSMNGDVPTIAFDGTRVVTRYTAGLEGNFEFLDADWDWNAYYQRGVADSSETGFNIYSKTLFANALDAVTSPTTGEPVCRSTLTDPNNGCVPYNPMGLGVNSQAVLDYILGSPHRDQTFTQDVAAATVSGSPLDLWAGPLSIAAGIERREEKVSGSVDATSLTNGWFAGNYLPTFGKYHVAEAFVETLIPLVSDASWAQSLDLNAAFRRTDYSVSGLVSTWKIGATWQPIDDVRFRVTRSRDIRAPNLNELFAAGTANTNTVRDPFNNDQSVQYQGLRVGNTALKPEEADTLGIGFVVQPRFLEGFTASVDYYEVEIVDVIDGVGAQTIVDNCFAGGQEFCDAITRGIGPGGVSVITQIRLSPFNQEQMNARGVDLEASYQFGLDGLVSRLEGDMALRLLATRYLENTRDDGVSPPTDTVGSLSANGPPDWVYRATLSYQNDPLTVNLTGRGFTSGTYANNYIECTSGCPESSAFFPTINDNSLPGAFYLDASLSYRFAWNDIGWDAFLSIQNLTNEDPAIVPGGPAGLAFATPPTNPTLYDVLGTVYRVGVRMEF